MKEVTSATKTAPPAGGSLLLPVIQAMRLPHWVKNIFVLVAILFGGKLGDAHAWLMAGGAFFAFCLLSSGIYIINDIADRRADAAHPTKRNRPIASGRLPIPVAWGAATLLIGIGSAIITLQTALLYNTQAPLAGMGLAVWTAAYVLIHIAYSLGLKDKAILDVLIVALGFVLRAMAGAAAIAVPISAWLVVCTLTLCLFMALAKRRGELAQLGPNAATRRVNGFYTLHNVEHMLAVSAGLAITTYSLYCIAPSAVNRAHTPQLVWTIPLVVYGMFRFYCLTLIATEAQDPVKLVLRDRVLLLVGVLWLVLAGAILAWGDHPLLQGMLK